MGKGRELRTRNKKRRMRGVEDEGAGIKRVREKTRERSKRKRWKERKGDKTKEGER